MIQIRMFFAVCVCLHEGEYQRKRAISEEESEAEALDEPEGSCVLCLRKTSFSEREAECDVWISIMTGTDDQRSR